MSRIDFAQEIEWPNPEKDKPKEGKGKKGTSQPAKKTVPKKGQKRPSKREQSVTSETATPHPWTGELPLHMLLKYRLGQN